MTIPYDDAGTSGAALGVVRRIEVFTGGGVRRRWAADTKARIVAESYAAGVTVCEVARRHGLAPGQLFVWRRQMRRAAEARAADGFGFVPVLVETPLAVPGAGVRPERVAIELELGGARMRIANDAEAVLVGTVIAALKAGV